MLIPNFLPVFCTSVVGPGLEDNWRPPVVVGRSAASIAISAQEAHVELVVSHSVFGIVEAGASCGPVVLK